MTSIDSILAVAERYDTIVFDQWGVLHNGTTPYPEAVATIETLQSRGLQLCVLSNSGKRAAANKDRITGMGFPEQAFEIVMTSGEALAIDLVGTEEEALQIFFPITAKPEDAHIWAEGLSVALTEDLAFADAVLLMGLPDANEHPAQAALLEQARAMGLKLICSNPDRASPRADGVLVQSPGALAHSYKEAGGEVVFYGKPHRAIFDALFSQINATDPARVLMVGDSLEHDIAGAACAGWDSIYISGGLDAHKGIAPCTSKVVPTFLLPTLR